MHSGPPFGRQPCAGAIEISSPVAESTRPAESLERFHRFARNFCSPRPAMQRSPHGTPLVRLVEPRNPSDRCEFSFSTPAPNAASSAWRTVRTLLHQQTLPADRRHARDLVPAMQEAVQAVGWKLRSVELLVVSAGPGSYTGLRVGIAAVKALALTNDARSHRARFAGSRRQSGGECEPHRRRRRRPAAAHLHGVVRTEIGRIASTDRTDDAGSHRRVDRVAGVRRRRDRACRRSLGTAHSAVVLDRRTGEPRSPTAESLLALALRDLAAERFADLHSLEPIYLRPSAAEERKASAGELARP